ncbi:MAG TPA: helix-turn-helix domain-containing protein [Candidatus Dormibacteraeota bacterium]|nr:helix-turn-helix domain-containing protein [Candidatus Dormibacteraeota bacterium]
MASQRPDEPFMIAGRSTRMEVLELLRRKGRLSAETVASDLGVTPNAVRQHLSNLEREGFVVSHPERSGRGRPSLLFSLTERADSVFPKRYGQLATMVLQEVQQMGGPEALDEVFSRVAARHADAIQPALEGLDFDEKVRRVVVWIGRAGTLAEQTETSEGVKVTIHNCPFRNTALKFPQVCTITPHLMSRLLGTAVSQADSIHRHDPYCSFVVQRPAVAD